MSDSPLAAYLPVKLPWMPPRPFRRRLTGDHRDRGFAAGTRSGGRGVLQAKHDDAPAAPQYSEQRVADAKKNLRDAYKLSINAIQTAGRTTSEDPNQYMLALNTRLAFNTAADYLANESSTQIAAPSALLDQFHSLVGTYRKMVLILTTEAAKADTDAIFAEVDSHESAIQKECG